MNIPVTATPVTVIKAHHNDAGEREEEDEARGRVDNRGGCRD